MLSAYERETIINYNMADQDATIYTHDKKMIARLEKLSAKFPDDFKRKSQSPSGDATYIFPKKYLSIREPYSEARRQAARERALKGNMKPPKRSKNP